MVHTGYICTIPTVSTVDYICEYMLVKLHQWINLNWYEKEKYNQLFPAPQNEWGLHHYVTQTQWQPVCVPKTHTEFLHSEDSVVAQLNKEETYTQLQDGRHPTADPHNASERSRCPLHPVRWDARCWHHSGDCWHHNRHEWRQKTAASQEVLSCIIRVSPVLHSIDTNVWKR